MKKLFRNFLLKSPFFESCCRFLTRNHVRVFMYHRFAKSSENAPGRTNQELLRTQLGLIRQNHPLITPNDHLQVLAGRKRGVCPVIITVDDGYLDCFEYAFPLFQEFQIPAMVFVTTGFAAGTHWFWWDKIAWIFNGASATVREIPVLGETLNFDLSTTKSKAEAWSRLADRCRFFSYSQISALLADLAVGFDCLLPEKPPSEYSAVSWDQVRIMADKGILFGAHTVSHPILTRVTPSEADSEIIVSQDQLSRALGGPVKWFCYPQGGPADFNPRVRASVAQHYSGCYLAYQDMQYPPDPYALPRYQAPQDLTQFRWVLCGAEYLVLKLKSILGLKTGPGDFYWEGSQSTEDQQ